MIFFWCMFNPMYRDSHAHTKNNYFVDMMMLRVESYFHYQLLMFQNF